MAGARGLGWMPQQPQFPERQSAAQPQLRAAVIPARRWRVVAMQDVVAALPQGACPPGWARAAVACRAARRGG